MRVTASEVDTFEYYGSSEGSYWVLITGLEDTMDITYVGSWIFVGLGVLLVVSGVYVYVAQRRSIIIPLIFGVLCMGLGIHGPLFMGPYAEWLRAMLAMVRTNNPESVQKVLNEIGNRDFDSALQKITRSYILNHPIQNMDSLLTKAINSASNEQGKNALIQTQQELTAKIEMARLLSHKLRPEEIKTLDPETRTLIEKELKRLPKQEFNRTPASNLRPIGQPDQLKQKLEK